jgi:hypothetical protein
MKKIIVPIIAITLLVTLSFAQQAPPSHPALTNDDVQAMLKVGVEEKLVLEAIAANPASYTKTPEAIDNLRKSGASDRVIAALMTAPAIPVATTAAVESKYPTEVGIYAQLKEKEKFAEIEPEITNWKTGGLGKSLLTMGVYMGHINGTVRDPHSQVKLTTASSILIYCPEGVGAAEYQLLKLREKGDRREFKVMTMWMVHSSGGPDSAEKIAYHAERVAPRTYLISLEGLRPGEYGLLPPGAVMTANQASTGKIYSFAVLE